MLPKFMPARPAASHTDRSVSFGMRRYTSCAREAAVTRGVTLASVSTRSDARSLVSNINPAPRLPRVSTLTTTAMSRERASSRAKAFAPRRPCSSPSVKRRITSCSGGGVARSARAVSRRTATPYPSSDAPGASSRES
jgi:hypothetical protein